MIALKEPATCTRSSTPRWGFEWIFLVATFALIAHGLGCHGDDIDHEPAVTYEHQDRD